MNNKMAINTYLSKIELKIKVSEKAEEKQTPIYRECFDSFQTGVGLGG